MKQNVNSQTLHIIDEDLEIISDDDEIYLDQLIEPVNNKQSNYEDVLSDEHELNTQLPANDVDLPHDADIEVEPTTDHNALDGSNVYDVTITIRNDYVQEIVSDVNYQSNDDLNVPNYDLHVDNHVIVDEDNNIIQSLPIQRRSCHQRRTARSRRRRNRKRNNSLRAQHYRYYMIRHIYHRFHMPLIKIILRQHDINYIHAKIVTGILVIGVKNAIIRQHNEQQLPDNIFDRHHHYLYRRQHDDNVTQPDKSS